jgi:hypothetical protein
LVTFKVGALAKVVLVTGDRVWQARWLGKRPSEPAPFEKIQLKWELAFGGWDRSSKDPNEHTFERRNPVGVGYRERFAPFVENSPLPNVEDPDDRQTGWSGNAKPAGFGVVGPNWHPRAKFAGTYGAQWDKTRKPLLPTDFDRRFFNCAAPGLTAKGFLRGDEPVIVQNASAAPLAFTLPGMPPPRCRLTFRHKPDETLDTQLDTVVVDTDLMRVILTWRAHTLLRDGPLDVRSYLIASAGDSVWTRASSTAGAP